MVEVRLRKKNAAGKWVRYGEATFAALPLTRPQDFTCSEYCLSFPQAQRIAAALERDERSGEVDGIRWDRVP